MNKWSKMRLIGAGLLLLLLVVLFSRFSPEKIYTEQELNTLTAAVTSKAVETKNLAACESLPEVLSYEATGRAGSSIGIYTSWPRSQCYWDYMQKAKDSAACAALAGVTAKRSNLSDSNCYSTLAQALGDVNLCDKAYDPERSNCRAKILKDVGPCYEINNNSKNSSKYPPLTQYCLGAVALEIRSFEPCLLIDGPDFGDQWRIGRNQCLENVARAFNLKPPELNQYCAMMVDDEPGWDIKRRCLLGETLGTEAQASPSF